MFARYEEWQQQRRAKLSNCLRQRNNKKPRNHQGWGVMINNQGTPSRGIGAPGEGVDLIGARLATAKQISEESLRESAKNK